MHRHCDALEAFVDAAFGPPRRCLIATESATAPVRKRRVALVDESIGQPELEDLQGETVAAQRFEHRAACAPCNHVFLDRYQKLVAAREIADGGHGAREDEARGWALIGMSVFLGMRYGIWKHDMAPEQVADLAIDFVSEGLRKR